MIQTVKAQLTDHAQNQLKKMSASAAWYATSDGVAVDSEQLQNVLAARCKETGKRFEIIDYSGKVLFTSNPIDWPEGHTDSSNQRNKSEVISALETGSGYIQRDGIAHSASVIKDENGQATGFIRVSESAESMDYLYQSLRRLLWCFSGLIAIVTSISMGMFSRNALQPLSQFAEVARQIGTGRLDSVPSLHGRQDDWGALSDAFRHMQTELKRREVSILDNSSRLQAVLSSMIEGVVAIDHQGSVMLANGAACQMLGKSHGQIFGREFLEIFRNPELTAAITRTQKERSFSKCEFQTRDEPRRTIAARVSVLTNESAKGKSRSGVAVVLHDITDIRQLENMRRELTSLLADKTELGRFCWTVADHALDRLADSRREENAAAMRAAFSQEAVRAVLSFDPSEMPNSLKILDAASRDLEDGLFHALKAWSMMSLVMEDHLEESRDTLAAINVELEKARQLAPGDAMVYGVSANVRAVLFEDYSQAVTMSTSALRAQPNNVFATQAMTLCRFNAGAHDAAYRMSRDNQIVAAATKYGAMCNLHHALLCLKTNRADEALAASRAAVHAVPNYRAPSRQLVALYAANGLIDKAIATVTALSAVEPEFSIERLFNDPEYPANTLRETGVLDRARTMLGDS